MKSTTDYLPLLRKYMNVNAVKYGIPRTGIFYFLKTSTISTTMW